MNYYFGNADSLSHALPVKSYWKWDPRTNKYIFNPGYVAKKRNPAIPEKSSGPRVGGFQSATADDGTKGYLSSAQKANMQRRIKSQAQANILQNRNKEAAKRRLYDENNKRMMDSAERRYSSPTTNLKKDVGRATSPVRNAVSDWWTGRKANEAYNLALSSGDAGRIARTRWAYENAPQRVAQRIGNWVSNTLNKIRNTRFGKAIETGFNWVKDKVGTALKAIKGTQAYKWAKKQFLTLKAKMRRVGKKDDSDDSQTLTNVGNIDADRARVRDAAKARGITTKEYNADDTQELMDFAQKNNPKKQLTDWNIAQANKRRQQERESRRYEW